MNVNKGALCSYVRTVKNKEDNLGDCLLYSSKLYLTPHELQNGVEGMKLYTI